MAGWWWHMRADQRDEGITGLVLVLVIAWALLAVLMLTGILISARSIDDDVAVITGEVSEIDDDLDSVALAEETSRIAADIETAAAPLSAQLDEVHAATLTIDESVATIHGAVGDIDASVNSITASAESIDSSVQSIHGSLSGTDSAVVSIRDGIMRASGQANTVVDIANRIDRDTSAVHGQTTEIVQHAESINCGVLVSLLGLLAEHQC